MALESANYITQLVTTNPTGADQRLTADDHLRLIKRVLQNTFPLLASAVSATAVELNYCMSASANIQDQLNSKLNKSGGTVSGAVVIVGSLTCGELSSTAPISADYANSASYAISANHAASATQANSAVFANSATNATNAVNSTNATNATSATFAGRAVNADSATYAFSATNATNAVNASNATNATNASYATNAGYAANSNLIDGYDYSQLWRTDQASFIASTNGSRRSPDGFQIRWGTGVSTTDSAQGFTFSTPFASACFGVFITRMTASAESILPVTSVDINGFTIDRESGIIGSAGFYYFAIGY